MTTFMRSHFRRIALVVAVAASAAALALAAAIDGGKEPAVDPDEYAYLMANKVADVYDLEDYFVAHQYDYLPIALPEPDTILAQPGFPEVLPFDPQKFPKEFNAALVGAYEYSVPVYSLTVMEDPNTRETVFLNAEGKEIYALPPAPGYDPFAWLKNRWPSLYAGGGSLEAIQFWQSVYDPARVQLKTKLISQDDVEPYLYAKAAIAAAELDPFGGGGSMMLMSENSNTDIVFTAFQRVTNGLRMSITYTNGFTNRLDIFTCNDLMPEIWTIAIRELPTAGTNLITWVDTNAWIQSGLPVRFYAAADASTDADGDGYPDGRELMAYQTDPNDPTSHPVRVSGIVSYSGIETGNIFVVIVTESNSWSLAKSVSLPGPAAYTNDEVGNGQSYWFKAFRDADGDSTRDAWEPWGIYSGISTLVTGDTPGINITVADVPSIWGTIDYDGSKTGDIHVIAVTSSNSWDMTHETVIPWVQSTTTNGDLYVTFPIGFSIVGLPASNYWIRAFIDSDTNTVLTLGEAAGQYTSNAIPISNRVTGINFTLDVDSDGDEMPDWWEWGYGFNALDASDKYGDRDGDGAENYKEFLFGIDPDDTDSDNDGMTDGFEVQYAAWQLSPTSTNDVTGDYDADGLANLDEFKLGTFPNDADSDDDRISDGPSDPDGAGQPVVAGPDPNPLTPAPLNLPEHLTPDDRHVASIGEDAQGRPTIVWIGRDNRGFDQVYAFKWFGTAPETIGQWAQLDGMWESFGYSGSVSGIVASTGGLDECDADFDTNGWPTVVWTENRGFGKNVYALRWQTNQWAALGTSYSGAGISGDTGIQGNPSIAQEPDGSLSVAWEKAVGGGLAIHLKRWSQTGQTWNALGNSTNTYGLSGSSGTFVGPQVAVGSDLLPVVSYWAETNNQKVAVYARKWDGSSTWNLLGSTVDSTPSAESFWPDMFIGNGNTPQVGWIDIVSGPSYALWVRQFTNSAWSGYGGSDSGTGLATGSFLTIIGHSLWKQTNGSAGAVWSQIQSGGDYAVFARQWNGTAWKGVGTTNNSSTVRGLGFRTPWTKVTAAKGSPVIVYAEKTGPNSSDPCRLVVRQFVADTDGDGLSDLLETAQGFNSGSADTDSDGVSDALEWNFYGTSVTNADSDTDGLNDGEEVNASLSGLLSDPLNSDTDGDGILDGCDWLAGSPEGDADADGIFNDLDSDDDNDGWSDAYETGTSGTDPLNADSDCDGIPDSLDTGGADTTPPIITIIEPVEGASP